MIGLDPETESNRRLAIRLHDVIEFQLDHADIYGLRFYVQDGEITVYGTVGGSVDRQIVSSIVSQVEGVVSVHDRLQVSELRVLAA